MVNLTQTQIEALMDEKGNPKKCLDCGGTASFKLVNGEYHGSVEFCQSCQKTGQATIEIEKEWVECPYCQGGMLVTLPDKKCRYCNGKGVIPKYKVGDVILTYIAKQMVKFKIISETKDKKRLIMVR